MAIVSCDECGKEVSTLAESCPHCGAKQQQQPASQYQSGEKPFKWWLWVPVGLIAAFFLFGALSKGPTAQAKESLQHDIDKCWKEAFKAEPGTRGREMLYQACENMKRDYLIKFGESAK